MNSQVVFLFNKKTCSRAFKLCSLKRKQSLCVLDKVVCSPPRLQDVMMDVIFSSVGSGTLSNTVTVIYLLLGSVLIKKKKKKTPQNKMKQQTKKMAWVTWWLFFRLLMCLLDLETVLDQYSDCYRTNIINSQLCLVMVTLLSYLFRRIYEGIVLRCKMFKEIKYAGWWLLLSRLLT